VNHLSEKLDKVLTSIKPLDTRAMVTAQERQNNLTKPQGSLGRLEDLSVQIAGIKADPAPEIVHKAIVTMAADHGVVQEGVSLYPQEVTRQMVLNFLNGGAGINVLAKHMAHALLSSTWVLTADMQNDRLRHKKHGCRSGNDPDTGARRAGSRDRYN
jgi:nicotinate-nucleotide--dimethylbenzimidazole phosphoribosyltransferase